MRDPTVEEVDEIIDRLVYNLEIVKIDINLSRALTSALNYRRTYRSIFFRLQVPIPVAGTNYAVNLFADMGAN